MMETVLRQGLEDLSLPLEGVPALVRYAGMLAEKNQVMNLTAITDPLDSTTLLTLADFRGKAVVDVGTGAGFPGLPLRIVEPSIHLTLLDAQRKRVDFLREVCGGLDLDDVECVHERAEVFAAERRETFDIAVSRAVAALPVLAELCLPLVKVGGQFLAMKSVDSGEELSAAGRAVSLLGGKLEKPIDYGISGTNIRHRLVIITKICETQKKYPRTFAKIKKNPL